MLTRKQYKFLKKVSKNEIPCDDLKENRDRIFLYLLDRKLIETHLVCPDNDIYEKNTKSYCNASESGNVELILCKQEWYRFWVPTALSVIAIIASFIAIFTQNVELWIWLKELLK